MEFPFLADRNARRYCYVRLRIVEELVKDEAVLDALVAQLEVPGKPAALRKLTSGDKVQAIDGQIAHYRKTKTSIWHSVDACEVLAASIYRAWRSRRLPDRAVARALSPVRREADLAPPIAAWLTSKGLESYLEVPLGTKRVDVVGYRKAPRGREGSSRPSAS